VAKFRRMAEGVISRETADRVLEQAWKLDERTDVTPLFSFATLPPRLGSAHR
jgi:hypothetical protein